MQDSLVQIKPAKIKGGNAVQLSTIKPEKNKGRECRKGQYK